LGYDIDPDKILNQFKAAQKGLDKTHFLLLDKIYRKNLSINIVEGLDAAPGIAGMRKGLSLWERFFFIWSWIILPEKIKRSMSM